MEKNKKIYLTLIITAILFAIIVSVVIYQNLKVKDSLNKSYTIDEISNFIYTEDEDGKSITIENNAFAGCKNLTK